MRTLSIIAYPTEIVNFSSDSTIIMSGCVCQLLYRADPTASVPSVGSRSPAIQRVMPPMPAHPFSVLIDSEWWACCAELVRHWCRAAPWSSTHPSPMKDALSARFPCLGQKTCLSAAPRGTSTTGVSPHTCAPTPPALHHSPNLPGKPGSFDSETHPASKQQQSNLPRTVMCAIMVSLTS
jgi:hypothetical protein